MRITEAAQALGTSPRMLRYRESLGLLPPRHQRRAKLRESTRGEAAHAEAADAEAAHAEAPHGKAARGKAARGLAGRDGQSARGAQAVRDDASGGGPAYGGRQSEGLGAAHRQFSDADLAAAALGLSIEHRYDISPAALAFGIRVLADPRVRSEVAELGRRIGRIQAPPTRALDFEQQRALRLLRLDQQRP